MMFWTLISAILGLSFAYLLELDRSIRNRRNNGNSIVEKSPPHEATLTGFAALWLSILILIIISTFAYHGGFLPPLISLLLAAAVGSGHLIGILFFVLGFLAWRSRKALTGLGGDLRLALFGPPEHQNRSVQIGLLLAIFALPLLMFTNVLDRIEEFSVGGAEIKMAAAQTQTKETLKQTGSGRANSKATLSAWQDFIQSYDVTAGPVTKLMGLNETQDGSYRVTEAILNQLVRPVAVMTGCIESRIEPRFTGASGELARVATAWQAFSLSEGEQRQKFDLERLIAATLELPAKLLQEAQALGISCQEEAELISQLATTAQLTQGDRRASGERAINWLAAEGQAEAQIGSDIEAPSQTIQPISPVIDTMRGWLAEDKARHLPPYVIASVADLIALTQDFNAKISYLQAIDQKYKFSQAALSPDIMNFFYQLSDAKMRSELDWSTDGLLSNLDIAYEAVDSILSHLNAALNADKNAYVEYKSKRISAEDLLQYYERNRFVIMTSYVDVFNRAITSQEAIEDHRKLQWQGFFDELQEILATLSREPIGFRASPAIWLSSSDKERWRSNKHLNSRLDNTNRALVFQANARSILALGAVLLNGNTQKPPQSACLSAEAHLANSERLFKRYFDLSQSDFSETEKELSDQLLRRIAQVKNSKCDA
ncbi:hypothetical protein [Microvirga sp. VF16]|uniref:hypothetical protein n=1 Tax=Microvirga sp. VF16 TaxID=2807101 RepID=UPI00193CBB06|nr:hypothetical protein [Microvirga sp. VF16]QRM36052.1 hypothetical protein JO965_45575 [Microvirga sp. VF16]